MWRSFLLLACATAACAAGDYFQIKIVDEQTGGGVPLVELRTTNKISCWTDNNGEEPILAETGQTMAEVAQSRGVPVDQAVNPKQRDARRIRHNGPVPYYESKRKVD